MGGGCSGCGAAPGGGVAALEKLGNCSGGGLIDGLIVPGPTICQLAVLPALSIGTLPAIETTRTLNLWKRALPGTAP